MAYHLQKNEQAGRFKKTIMARLRHYVEEHRRDWDNYVQLLTYAYNTQVHHSTNLPPFRLVLSPQPPRPTIFNNPRVLTTDTTATASPHVLRGTAVPPAIERRKNEDRRMKSAQPRNKGDHDKRMPNPSKNNEVEKCMSLNLRWITTSTAWHQANK